MNMLVRVYRVDGQKMEWIPKLYCVFGIIFGNLTLLALFIGIMLQGFESLASKIDESDSHHIDFEDSCLISAESD